MRRAVALALTGIAACAGDRGDDRPLCGDGCPGGVVQWTLVPDSYESRIEAVVVDAFGGLVVAGTFGISIHIDPFVALSESSNFGTSAFMVHQQFAGDAHGGVAFLAGGASVALGGLAVDHDGQTLVVTAAVTSPASLRATIVGDSEALVADELFQAAATPVIVTTVDRYGRAIAAISTTDLERAPGPALAGARATIIRVDQGLQPTVLVSWPDVVIRALVLDPAADPRDAAQRDGIIVVGDYGGTPAPRFAPCAGRCGFAARLAADGTLDADTGWVTTLASATDAALTAVARGPDGQLVALGFTGATDEAALLVRIGATAGAIVERTPLAEPGAVIGARHLAVGPDRTLYVALSRVVGQRQLNDGSVVDRFETSLEALAIDGSVRWKRTLGSLGSIDATLLVVARGLPILAGTYWGAFALGDADAGPAPPTKAEIRPHAYLLAFGP